MKPHLTESGEKEMDVITTSQALQIAGRAGRYKTTYENGEVTTFRQADLGLLKEIVARPIDPIEVHFPLFFYLNYFYNILLFPYSCKYCAYSDFTRKTYYLLFYLLIFHCLMIVSLDDNCSNTFCVKMATNNINHFLLAYQLIYQDLKTKVKVVT